MRVLTETVLQHLPGVPERGGIRRLGRGNLIYATGDPTGEVFYLRSGRVALSVLSADGREPRLRLVQPGEMFGELCFCDVRARQEQATALDESEVLAVEMDTLLTAALSSAEAASAFLGTLCARVGEAEAPNKNCIT